MTGHLVSGMLAGYGIAIPVGAIAVLVVGTGIRCGFACAAAAGAGAASADLVYAGIAATVGAGVAGAIEPWSRPLRVAAALVLAAVALRGVLTLRRHPEPALPAPGRGRLGGTYLRFAGLTLVNPLTVIYFTSLVLGAGVDRPAGVAGAALFAAGAFAASLSWQLLLAGAGTLGRRGLSTRWRVATLVIGNVMILGFAVRIVVQA